MKRIILSISLSLFLAGCLQARNLRVAFVGDPQADNHVELEYVRNTIYRELQGRRDLDMVIVLGDLVNDNPQLLLPVAEMLDSLRCPWFAVPGNHDHDVYHDKARARDLATWRKIIGYEDTTFVYRNVRFILANNVRYGGRGGYEGGFDERQMKWLDSLSKVTPVGRHVVLATHIPVSACEQRDSILRLFSSHKEMLLASGHTHTVARHTVDSVGKVEEMIAGAVCGSWWRGVRDEYDIPYALQNCGAPRGWFVTDFGRRTCTHRYCPISDENECSVYAASTDNGNKMLYVNVFGGHVDGSVSVVVPGYGRLCMTRTADVACEVREVISFNRSLSDEERRSRRNEIIPLRRMKSPHLWSAELPGSMELSKVKVIYKDPDMSFKKNIRTVKFLKL